MAAVLKGLLRQAPLYLLAMQVPTGMPEVLLAVRGGFIATTLLIAAACAFVTHRIKAADDRTVIWVRRPVDPAAAQRLKIAKMQAEAKGQVWTPPKPPSLWRKTSYVEFEQEKAKVAMQSQVIDRGLIH